MELNSATFAAHLADSDLIRPDSRVVVAVSGGRDSVALLHLLVRLRRGWRLDLVAAHLDHRMRPESGADARWLAGVCRAWGVPLVPASARVAPRSEAEARAVRYDLLRAVRRVLRADVVATAHHRDDQAETVLMRIARGTGMRGLRGIAARRGRLVRPLLPFDRAAIDAYCAATRLAFREDPSNADPRWLRNRLRHGLMPALGPGVARAAADLALDASTLERAWRGELASMEQETVQTRNAGFAIARDRLARYDPAARARLLRKLCAALGTVPTRAATDAALALIAEGSAGAGLDLGGGVRLERGLAELRLSLSAERGEPDETVRIEGTRGHARASVGGRGLSVAWAPAKPVTEADPLSTLVDMARLPLELRAWRPGDRIRLAAGSRKLKKLFNDWRVERPERTRTPVLVDDAGRVLWVAGRVAAVDAATAGEPLLRISVRDAEIE